MLGWRVAWIPASFWLTASAAAVPAACAAGVVVATLFTYPSLAASPENVDEITEYVIKRHGERMKDIHLKA